MTPYGTTRTPISSRRFPTTQPHRNVDLLDLSADKQRASLHHPTHAIPDAYTQGTRAPHRASFHHLRFRHRPARHPGHPKPTLDPDTQARRSKHRAETCRHGQSGTQQVAQRAHRRPYVSLPRPSCVRLTTTTPQVGDLYIVLYDAILDGRAGHDRDGL